MAISAREKRLQLEKCLLREENTLNQIKNSMAQADATTQAMSSILESFGTRLDKLEKAVIPVHRETKNLQTLQENIVKVLGAIDNVVSYHNIVKKRQAVINEPIEDQLDEYMDTMAELQSAVNFFKQTSDDTPELKKVTNLYNRGRTKMVEYYKSLLHNHSSTVGPNMLDSIVDSKQQCEVDLPENITAELNKISNWLLNNLDDYSGFTDLYGEIREKIVCSSLADLYSYNCSLSANTPRKRLTIRRQTTRTKSFRRKSRKSIMEKDNSTSKLLDGPKIGDQQSFVNDMGPFGRRVVAFNKLIRREIELMNLVLPNEFHAEVFDKIVTSSLKEISDDAQNFLLQLDESLKVPEYGALLQLCPTISQLKSVSLQIVQSLRLVSDKNRSTIPKIIRDFELKGSDILDDFEDNVKSDKEYILPSDCTVHQINSNVIHFIASIRPYANTIGNMIGSRKSGGANTSPDQNFNEYVRCILTALNLTLQNKMNKYEHNSERWLFLMNNYHFIKERLIDAENEENPIMDYDSLENQAKDEYFSSWNALRDHCISEIKFSNPSKLSDKEKAAVKDKLKKFNSRFENLIHLNRRLIVSDKALLNSIKLEINEILLPAYVEMRKTYSTKEFCKPTSVGKYIKYGEDSLAGEIDNIFDSTA